MPPEQYSVPLVVINSFLVFFMQTGFIVLETGSGRAKNVRHILLKNLLDVSHMCPLLVGSWLCIGYRR
eukprot:jgi/Chrzof1/9233/Cz03g40250.t1